MALARLSDGEPAMLAPPGDAGLPDGFEVALDERVRVTDGGRALIGGSPTRLLRLAPEAQRMLRDGRLIVEDRRSAVLARRLLDTGVAHPRPRGISYGSSDVTVVVPVRDRADQLRRLLSSIAGGPSVVVVDDGSVDGAGIEAAASEFGATVVRHAVNRGVATARNTGLRAVRTQLVCFLDSDCVGTPGWLDPLLAHFADPAVALVAPRIVALRCPGSWADWLVSYEQVRAALDLGPGEARVVPRGRVSWVPGAAIVARRSALGRGFCEEMAAGEDVDLVWRLHEAGWHVRYEPSSQVAHDHRTTWRAWLTRRAFYGTSAAPLARRHGDYVAPVVIAPWAAAAWLLLLTQRRRAGIAAAGITLAAIPAMARRLEHISRPRRTAAALVAAGFVDSGSRVASAITRHWWPAAAAACVISRRARRAVLGAIVMDGSRDWIRRRPALDPVRYLIAHLADDLAYGTGLWWGAIVGRSPRSLLPAVGSGSRRRTTSPDGAGGKYDELRYWRELFQGCCPGGRRSST
jgi:mycofactocin glycosyltransferase